jgi:hypothetical protein
VIDITCSACDITYHADETHLGKGLRCKVCGKILLVERQEIGPSLLHDVVQSTVSKRKRNQNVWLGVGIILAGIVLFAILFWMASPQPEAPSASSITSQAEAIPSDIKLPAPLEHLKPIEPSKHPALIKPIYPNIPQAVIPHIPLAVFVPKCAEGQQAEAHATGDKIEDDDGTNGKSKLLVQNGLDLDAAVRLVDASTRKTSRFVYIRAHDQYKRRSFG